MNEGDLQTLKERARDVAFAAAEVFRSVAKLHAEAVEAREAAEREAEAVEARLKRCFGAAAAPPLVVCAWCHRQRVAGEWVLPGTTPIPPGPITHGICPGCAARVMNGPVK